MELSTESALFGIRTILESQPEFPRESVHLAQDQPNGLEEQQRRRHEEETAALEAMFSEQEARDSPGEFSNAFACRLTLEPFREPVVSTSGLSYERSSLLNHLQNVSGPANQQDLTYLRVRRFQHARCSSRRIYRVETCVQRDCGCWYGAQQVIRFAAPVPQVGKFDPVTREPLVEGQVRLNLGLRAATQEYLVSPPRRHLCSKKHPSCDRPAWQLYGPCTSAPSHPHRCSRTYSHTGCGALLSAKGCRFGVVRSIALAGLRADCAAAADLVQDQNAWAWKDCI